MRLRDNAVHKPVIEEKLAGLKAVRQFNLHCGFHHVRAREADQGSRFCQDDVHQRGKAGGDATGILDWYHVSEHLWEAARALAADDEAAVWAHAALTQLHDGGGTALTNWLQPQRDATRGCRRTALQALRDDLITKLDRMDYPACRQRDWPVGSGMIEATCKQRVGARWKGSGMPWTEHGALAITGFRAADLNRHWHQTWNSLLLAG